MRFIIDKKPDLLDAKDVDGWTPLHVASYYGNGKPVTLLLDKGADKTAITNENETPEQLANQ